MNYRLYRFENGRIAEAADIACGCDADATRVVENVRDARAIELWQGARKVASWPAIPRAVSPAARAALSAAVVL
jgi:hypothetical protein